MSKIPFPTTLLSDVYAVLIYDRTTRAFTLATQDGRTHDVGRFNQETTNTLPLLRTLLGGDLRLAEEFISGAKSFGRAILHIDIRTVMPLRDVSAVPTVTMDTVLRGLEKQLAPNVSENIVVEQLV